ncbi:hypothetical protein BGZ94_000463 [Podila epigama]|nr:hypothetical protein BGZ94_000463 [Podila epigama]
MQADPSLNKEGYVRMTRVPRLGPAAETISDMMANMLFQPKNARPKDSYYAVLRYDTLFLYESDQQRDCKAVVPMNLFEVNIFPKNLPDNEVFNKEHPIQVKRKPDVIPTSSVLDNGQDEYYIFIHTPVVKEDWYLALLYASKLRKPGTKQKIQDKAQFDLEAIQNHIQTLHSDKHHEHTRWFNSFLGRIFLGVYKTKKIQEVFIQKITRKTLKLKRPSFLGEIKVRSFAVGHSIPYITRTKLLDLALNGELLSEFHLAYKGGVRVEIEVDVGLGLNSLKPVKVTIVLAVLVKSISGMMTLKIKAPPTNRFWIGFQEPPEMDIVIEPIVADKAIKLNMVISAIESKIREAMVEAIVLPNMDDYPFFDSHGTGGIFEGDEEIVPEQATDSEAESSTNVKSTKSTSTKALSGARRGSESSQFSESSTNAAERKLSWSSTCTDSDAEPEIAPLSHSSPVAAFYINQNSSSSNTSQTPALPIPIANTMAAKFKRFSQAHFSTKSTESLSDASKLNTKPTVATSIATAIRTSPATSHTIGNAGSTSSKLSSAIPKLSAVSTIAESADHAVPRIFASTSSNAISKKDSSNSLRRLATLESPTSDDSESTTTGADEAVTPTPGADSKHHQTLACPSKAHSKDSSRPEFDTFPRSTSVRKWDSTPAAPGSSPGTGSGSGSGSATFDEHTVSSSSSHIGIAGILDGHARSSANTVQGNLASLFASAVDKKKRLQNRNSTGSSTPSDASADDKAVVSNGNVESSAKDHGRKNSGDGLLPMRLKKDLLLRRNGGGDNKDNKDKEREETSSIKSFGSLLGGHRRRGSLPNNTNKANVTPGVSKSPRNMFERTLSSNSVSSNHFEGSVPTGHPVDGETLLANGANGSWPPAPPPLAHRPPLTSSSSPSSSPMTGSGAPNAYTMNAMTAMTASGKPPLSRSSSMSLSSTPSNSTASSAASATSSYLSQKSQAALGATKAWVKRSLEDRRMSEDDPLLSGKLGTTAD